MGDIPENERNWTILAIAKGYKCKMCKQPIPFGEQAVFFDRGICGHCAATLDKKE